MGLQIKVCIGGGWVGWWVKLAPSSFFIIRRSDIVVVLHLDSSSKIATAAFLYFIDVINNHMFVGVGFPQAYACRQ